MATKRKVKRPSKPTSGETKKTPVVYFEDLKTEDVLKLNQAVEIVQMEAHALSKPLYLWCLFIQAKIKKTVANYRAKVKELPDDEKYNKEMGNFPLDANPQQVEEKLKKKFPDYFAAMKELWEEPANLEVEKAKAEWLKNCQNSSGVVSLSKIDAFDDMTTLAEFLYE